MCVKTVQYSIQVNDEEVGPVIPRGLDKVILYHRIFSSYVQTVLLLLLKMLSGQQLFMV